MDATITSNLQSVRSRMDAAARRAGRDPSDIRLIAVSKTFSADHVRAAWSAGQREHLIGHLQSNKARKAAGAFACIHSIDSVDLLRKLDAAAVESGAAPEVLVQVDLAREETKFGAAADDARRIMDGAQDARAARMVGLMLIPPWNEDQEQTRPWFVRLRELRETWLADGVPPASLRHMSMGMSHDFEAAIEEGATLVRVGTAIFGKRTYGAA